MENFAEHVVSFYEQLSFNGVLPHGIRIMHPVSNNPETARVFKAFYHKFYSDHHPRRMIIGINPGRFGGGVTGIPFTDTKRLRDQCEIEASLPDTYEPSSVFIYDMIQAFGGPALFFRNFYITAVSPLGFTIQKESGKEVNYNYYDSKELTNMLKNFIVTNLKKQINFGIDTEVGYCLGTGKNFEYLKQLNKEHLFFKTLIPLEHPRFILQYKAKFKQDYIESYLEKLSL